MATSTVEQTVISTENIAHKNAENVMRQSQKVSLVDKKMNAIGKTVVAIDTQLAGVDTHTSKMYDTMDKVVDGQDDLTKQSNTLNESWLHMSKVQQDESESIKAANECLTDLKNLKTQTLNELQKMIEAQAAQSTTDAESFEDSITELQLQLETINHDDAMLSLETAINTVIDKIKGYQSQQVEREKNTTERIQRVMNVTAMLASAIAQYEALLTKLNAKVTYISEMVDAIDARVSDIKPKALDMSDDDIMQLFADYKADDKSVLIDMYGEEHAEVMDKIAKITVETQDVIVGNTQHQSETTPVESNVAKPQVEKSANVPEPQDTSKPTEKKKSWKFWK